MKGKGREASIPLERTVSVHVKHHETRDEAIDRARPIDTMIRLAQDLGDMYMSFADASTGVDDWEIGVDQGFKDDLLPSTRQILSGVDRRDRTSGTRPR